MKIVLDSAPLYGDYLLQSTLMQAVERYLSWTSDELLIAQVVIDATVRHFKNAYTESVNSHDRLRHLASVIDVQLDEPPSLEEAVERYRLALLDRLSDLEVRILPIPNVDVETVLQRDLAIRKPFDQSGKGFRDTLIWLSVLEDLKDHDEDVVIVSADGGFELNPKDKGNLPELHADLMKDVVSLGFDGTRVKVRRTLLEFNDEFVKPLASRAYRQGEPIEGTPAERLDPVEMLERYGEPIANKLHDSLYFIVPMGNAWSDRVTFVNWLGEVSLLEALDMGDAAVQAIIRTRITFDTDIYGTADDIDRLIEFSTGRSILVMGTSASSTSQDYLIQLRIALLTDIVFLWDPEADAAKGFDILRFGYTEDEIERSQIKLW